MSEPPEPIARDSRSTGARDALRVAVALLLAVFAASLVLWIGKRRAPETASGPAATSSSARRALPAMEEVQTGEPEGAVGRAVPKDVLRTSSVVAQGWELRLVRVQLEGDGEERRAELEDRATGDVRAYAIGDLLPHGSLLVGVSTGAADLMVGDRQLVRLHLGGRVEPIEDFRLAYQGQALAPAEGLDPDYADAVRLALVDLRQNDPTAVQAAIDRLVGAGDPAVELLIPHVQSVLPIYAAEYAFPSGGALQARPQVLGEAVMLILERITGQTFGDLTKETVAAEERAAVARSWQRWWGAQ